MSKYCSFDWKMNRNVTHIHIHMPTYMRTHTLKEKSRRKKNTFDTFTYTITSKTRVNDEKK